MAAHHDHMITVGAFDIDVSTDTYDLPTIGFFTCRLNGAGMGLLHFN
jgi:hypothetical protein